MSVPVENAPKAKNSGPEKAAPMTVAESPAKQPALDQTKPQLKVVGATEDPFAEARKRKPADGLLEEIAQESERLESATPQEIIDWAVRRFAPKFAMATAFGPEGMTIIHMLAEIAPQTPVFNLDTGYQFDETIELRNLVKRKYGIDVELKKPELTVDEYESLHGGPVYNRDPAQCCGDRKLRVLANAAMDYGAWASAIRRDQSPDRAQAPIIGWDKKFGLVKVSPLANWSKQDVWKLISEAKIPYNPLHDQGYKSIGCRPCTRAVGLGEDERAGRWTGFAKTECGLHSSD